MLIDWDNLQICHSRDAPGTDLDLNALIALAQSYGTLVSARAYAEWNLLTERLAVYKAGIEPVFAPVMRPEGSPREGKSLADTVMVADGVDLLWTVTPDVFVLVTSDKDMIPLARIAKQRGAAVVVLGSDLTAIPLVEMSNVFITYRQLLRELDRVSELEAPSGRAPARERRLRESRRPSSEPYGGSGAIGSGSRSVTRTVPPAVALRAPRNVYDAPPVRRIAEPIAPPEPERPDVAVTSPALTAPLASPPTPQADRSDLTSVGPSDATPRRRRRRGGRGRRPGLDAVGDDETVTVDAGSGTGEADDLAVDAQPVSSRDRIEARPEVRPDDLDTAVLELLAARDRQSDTPNAEPGPPAVEVVPEPVRTPSARGSSSRTPVSRTPARPRAASTSFSDFGPPSLSPGRSPAASTEAPSTPELEAAEAAVPASASSEAPSTEAASPSVDETSAVTTPEFATATASSDEANAAASLPASDIVAAPVENGTAPSEPALEGSAASPVDAAVAADVTSGSADASAEVAVESEPSPEPKRPRPVRRRTRRPTTRKAADAATEPAAASESGT